MSDRFQDKYRIPSSRAFWWDYGRNAAYFVTICVQDRDCYFGSIIQKKFIASSIGVIAQSCWQEIPQHFPYTQLDSFVVMPNHLHGIIIIDKRIEMIVKNESISEMDDGMIKTTNEMPLNLLTNAINAPVETLHATSLQSQPTSLPLNSIPPINNAQPSNIKNERMASISPKWGTLGSIVRSYKSAVSKKAHFIHPGFVWQSRFYDTIIRNEQSYKIISDYIINNPATWNDDKLYKQ